MSGPMIDLEARWKRLGGHTVGCDCDLCECVRRDARPAPVPDDANDLAMGFVPRGPETPDLPIPTPDSLEQELAATLNRHSAENPSNTPDWILAQYLLTCLAAWNCATQQRDKWYAPADPRSES